MFWSCFGLGGPMRTAAAANPPTTRMATSGSTGIFRKTFLRMSRRPRLATSNTWVSVFSVSPPPPGLSVHGDVRPHGGVSAMHPYGRFLTSRTNFGQELPDQRRGYTALRISSPFSPEIFIPRAPGSFSAFRRKTRTNSLEFHSPTGSTRPGPTAYRDHAGFCRLRVHPERWRNPPTRDCGKTCESQEPQALRRAHPVANWAFHVTTEAGRFDTA